MFYKVEYVSAGKNMSLYGYFTFALLGIPKTYDPNLLNLAWLSIKIRGKLTNTCGKIDLFTTSNGMVIIHLQAYTRDFLKTKHNLICQTFTRFIQDKLDHKSCDSRPNKVQ